MILKIKNNYYWLFIDKISELMNLGECEVRNFTIIHQEDYGTLNPDASFINDISASGNGKCLALVLYYENKDKSSDIVTVQHAYLLNDEGKTIERLSV